MLYMNIIFILILLPLCTSDTPYLLRSYPTESSVVASSFQTGPCIDPLKTLSFLQGKDNASLNHSECVHDSGESILTCKLSVQNASVTLDLEKYPLDEIKVLILFVQEFFERQITIRVLDLCFLDRFGKSLEELAICGYRPPAMDGAPRSTLHILDVPALAIFKSKIQTLLLSSVNLWQSVELRQFSSLKHLLIIQGRTLQMQYYHSPHCADCVTAHPRTDYSFHYLIPLSSQLDYFLFDSSYAYDPCHYDLLKKIRSKNPTIPTFIVASNKFSDEKDKPICDTCESGLCPLLAVCLDSKSKERRNPKKPFDCLCVEDVDVEDEFFECDPLTLHQPMYSTRCNHTPSFWNYVTRAMMILVSYMFSSFVVFLLSTIFLCKYK